MEGYLTPAGEGAAEYTDKKSRFIGELRPVAGEGEARAFIEAARKKYPDASHHVFAYILREGKITRFSDDGEPGGTAGLPVLNIFRLSEIYDVCCVVTRYFGGTLLGSGGLVRAYSKAAQLALENAGVARMEPWRRLCLRCPYHLYDRALRLLESCGCIPEGADFGEDVSVAIAVKAEKAAELKRALTDLSGAAIGIEDSGEVLKPNT